MTKIIAHRGASSIAPENTLIAFERAIELKSDGIELDVHLTKNGVPIVIHDFDLERTTNGTGFIVDHTLESIKKLDAGSWFSSNFSDQKVPTLEEVFQLCKSTPDNFIINVELKAGSKVYPQIEEKVLRLVDQYHLKEKVLISSFDHYAIEKIKNLDEDILTGALFSSAFVSPWRYLSTLKFDAYHTAWHRLDNEIIEGCHKNGLIVNAYTLDDISFAKVLMSYNIDGIITNTPQDLLRIKNEDELL
jgi:glycerophosphoryl diester phosphodiesterase